MIEGGFVGSSLLKETDLRAATRNIVLRSDLGATGCLEVGIVVDALAQLAANIHHTKRGMTKETSFWTRLRQRYPLRT